MQLGDKSLRRIARPEEVKALGFFLRANSRSLEDSFRNFDTNSLGHLTLDSFQAGLGRMGYDGPNAEGVFRAIDSTHTGLISLHSFLVAFAGTKEDGSSSWGSTTRGHTPRLERSMESQLSWPESLEEAPTELPHNLGLLPQPLSSESLKGAGLRSLPELAQQLDKVRSELQVERTERQVEFAVLRERLTSPSAADWQARGLASAEMESWRVEASSSKAELQNHSERLAALEGSLHAETRTVPALGIESSWRAEALNNKAALENHSERIAALEGSLHAEVEEVRKKLRELESQLHMQTPRPEDAGLGPSIVRNLAQQIANLERSLHSEVADVRKMVDAVDARSQAKVADSKSSATSSTCEAELQNHKQRIFALEASMQAEVEDSVKRMQVLDSRQEQLTTSFITQATAEAHLKASTAVRSELEAWKVQLQGFEAELQGQARRLVTLETSSQAEVKTSPSSSTSNTLALPPPSPVVPGLGLEAISKELQDLRQKFEAAVQTEARTRADEDRRIERAYSQDLKAGLGALAREINANASHLDEVRKSIGAEREERMSKQQAMSNMVADSLQAMIVKIDNSVKGLSRGVPPRSAAATADMVHMAPSADVIGTASETSSQDPRQSHEDSKSGLKPALSPTSPRKLPVQQQPVLGTVDKSAHVLQMIETLRQEVVQLRQSDVQAAPRRLPNSSSRCGSQDARPPLSTGGLSSPSIRAISVDRMSMDRSSLAREVVARRSATNASSRCGSQEARPPLSSGIASPSLRGMSLDRSS